MCKHLQNKCKWAPLADFQFCDQNQLTQSSSSEESTNLAVGERIGKAHRLHRYRTLGEEDVTKLQGSIITLNPHAQGGRKKIGDRKSETRYQRARESPKEVRSRTQ